MGRNAYRHLSRPSIDERASLGDGCMESAIARLKNVQQKAVAMLTSFHGSLHSVVPTMFDADIIDRANAARGIVRAAANTIGYKVGPFQGMGVTLYLDYSDFRTPAIEADKLVPQTAFFSTMTPFIEAVTSVHLQYEEIKAVLRWLNRNATPGAVRYLFPQAMKLVPDSPIWKDLQQVPSRYTQPDDIAAWTQAIKDAANTFAAMALLPEEAKARTRERGMWLTFRPSKVHLERVNDPNRTHYTTDEIVYNI